MARLAGCLEDFVGEAEASPQVLRVAEAVGGTGQYSCGVGPSRQVSS